MHAAKRICRIQATSCAGHKLSALVTDYPMHDDACLFAFLCLHHTSKRQVLHKPLTCCVFAFSPQLAASEMKAISAHEAADETSFRAEQLLLNKQLELDLQLAAEHKETGRLKRDLEKAQVGCAYT